MIQEFLSTTPLAKYPLAAFVLFFLTFLAVVISILVGLLKKQNFDRVADLPLEEDVTDLGEPS